MKRNKVLALLAAVALGLEIIAPGGEEQHPHTEKEIILAPEPTGAEADALRPFVTPPENPWLSDFALRVIRPEELEGWWVNTATTGSEGLVTVMRTQICGEARFKELAALRNPNTDQEIKPEFPFWPRKRHHSTPVSPVRDTVKRFFIGSTPYDLPSAAAQPKIAPFVAYFCNTSPSPNQLIEGFRYRLDHDPPIQSVSVAARSGPASPRTAASSDGSPPAKASSSGHV